MVATDQERLIQILIQSLPGQGLVTNTNSHLNMSSVQSAQHLRTIEATILQLLPPDLRCDNRLFIQEHPGNSRLRRG